MNAGYNTRNPDKETLDGYKHEYDDARQQSSAIKPVRVSPISATTGLLFIIVAMASLADRFWVDVDWVLAFGGIVCAAGLAMIAGVVVRSKRHHGRNRES